MKKPLLIAIAAWSISTAGFSQQINPSIYKQTSGSLSDNPDRVFVFGVGGADALQLEKLTASGGLNVGLKPIDKLTFYLNFNFGGTVRKQEKSDSVLMSSLYFPDIASTAFAGSLEYSMYRNTSIESNVHEFIGVIEGSVQGRNILKDTVSYNLNVSNLNMGIKYRWTYDRGENKLAIFNAGVFYSGIFINEGNEANFNSIFREAVSGGDLTPYQRRIDGINCLASVQLNAVTVYFRTFTNLSKACDLAFSIGLKASAEAFSF